MKALCLALVLAAAYLVAFVPRQGTAQIPTNCTFPTPPDELQSVLPGQKLDSARFNQMRCILNRLQARAIASGAGEVVCQNVTIQAAGRIKVTLAAASAVPSTAALLVSAEDNASPSVLEPAVERPDGTATVSAWVWNHGAESVGNGRVCVDIRR